MPLGSQRGRRRLLPCPQRTKTWRDGRRILRDGLKVAPKSAMLHHALGLALVRLKRSDEALAEFARASTLDPGNARYAYVNAVALHSMGKVDAAIARLEKAYLAHPNDRDIVATLASFHQGRGDGAATKLYAERVRALDGKITSEKMSRGWIHASSFMYETPVNVSLG